jgi:hypothetical protein
MVARVIPQRTIFDPQDLLKILLALQPRTPGEMPNSVIPLLAGLGNQRSQQFSPAMMQMLSAPGRELAGIPR